MNGPSGSLAVPGSGTGKVWPGLAGFWPGLAIWWQGLATFGNVLATSWQVVCVSGCGTYAFWQLFGPYFSVLNAKTAKTAKGTLRLTRTDSRRFPGNFFSG